MKNLIILGAVGVLALIVGVQFVGAYNYAVRAETQIIAEYDSVENVYVTYTQKLREAAQVPGMQRDDVKDILTSGLDARYGASGSQAAFQWIQEQNPNVGPEVYTQIQRIIEAGRNEFKIKQDRLIDIKRGYKTELGYLWKGTLLGLAGYPKINVGFPLGTTDDYPVISTAEVNNVMETGEEAGPIQLRQ